MGQSGAGRVLVIVGVLAIVVLAGCAGLGDTEPDRPAVFENTTASLDEETADAFEAALTDDNGELTAEGDAFLDRLAAAEAVGDEQRDAVARSVAEDGISEETITVLDQLLNSTNVVQTNVLRDGLADTDGDGLLDGEAQLLGLPADQSHPEVADAAVRLRSGGYDEADIGFLDQMAALRDDEFARTQARTLNLIDDAVANGSATPADTRRIEDSSGDGLLDGTETALGLPSETGHPEVAALARPLAAEQTTYSETELAYLRRVATLRGTASGWEQAKALGLLAETADTGAVSAETVQALNDSTGDGLLDGLAVELGVGPETENETVVTLVDALAAGGFDTADLAFLDSAAAVAADDVSLAQARAIDLLARPTENGSATRTDRAALTDTSGDGLLDGFAAELGLDPAAARPTVADLAAPLAQGGYDETVLAYLERVETLTEYRGNDYERWAQAEQANLLATAVEGGTVTEQELRGLQNDDEDRLLNAIEESFGTDPTTANTSGDAYEDHLAWGPLRDLGLDVTPGEPDIHVEVEATGKHDIPSTLQQQSVADAFAASRTTTGTINVHFYECTTDREQIDGPSQMNDHVDDYRTMTGIGAHYLLISDGPFELPDGNAAGVAFISNTSSSWMLVDGSLATRGGIRYETSAVAHELGHSLGILADDYEGVDSEDVAASTYESVMNYNHWSPVTFSDGEPFDDYEWMADKQFGSYHQDTEALDAMWKNGSVDESVTC